MKISTLLRAAGLVGAASLLSACQPSIASLDCTEIAEEAQRIWSETEDRPVRVTQIRNPEEVSRTETEAVCMGEATWSDESTTIIRMRAFENENGVMVESGI